MISCSRGKVFNIDSRVNPVFYMFLSSVYRPLPHTISKEHIERQVDTMIKQRQNPIEGIASKFDYEKNEWK